MTPKTVKYEQMVQAMLYLTNEVADLRYKLLQYETAKPQEPEKPLCPKKTKAKK